MSSAKKLSTPFSPRLTRLLLLGGIVVLLLSFGFMLLRPSPDVPSVQTKKPQPTTTSNAVNRGLPVQLHIPRLNLEASITYTGLTKTGDMEAPKNMADVGWYKYGPLPGNTGSAVISGHVVGPRGQPAVFKDLDKMQVGDSFSIIDSTGQSTSFTVSAIRTYEHDEQPDEVFTSKAGAHLNLITCSGEWDQTQRRYLKRLVIFSNKST